MNAYKGFTEAQAKAHKKYMESQATIQLRTTSEQRDKIKDRAAALSLSVNQYILNLISADLGQVAPLGDMGAAGAGGVSPENKSEE